MQSQQVDVSIGAATTIPNVLAGLSVEFFGRAGVLTLYANADIALMTHTLFINDGQEIKTVIPPGAGLSVASTVGKIKTNEDFVGQYPIPGGVRLVWSVTNPGAASRVRGLYVVT